MSRNIDATVDQNPWPGLSSYEDPDLSIRKGRKPYLFCGRDEDSRSVFQLVTGNIFVTLYGKSGTGKTSLLNAGVFPLLRLKNYLPVSIRLFTDAHGISFQQAVICSLTQVVSNLQIRQQTVNVVPLPEDEQQPDYLWSYFARTRFFNADGQKLFPVIVLDQFEEIFRDRCDDAKVLLRQIAYLMDESHALSSRLVDGQPYEYDFNFRFIASIREDELYRLEDSIDNCYLPALKRCRYRLRGLTEQGARDAILIPGEGLFDKVEKENMVKKIVGKSRNKDGSINTNIVSLLCNRIYVYFRHSKDTHITLPLVESFMDGNPFERFYDEATRGFSNREKNYIEDNFVDSSGRRNSVTENDYKKNVKDPDKLLKGENRIFQSISVLSDEDNYRIELIHDSFCEPLKEIRQKRLQRKRVKQIVLISVLALSLILGAASIIFFIDSHQRLLISQSRFLAEKVSALVDEGDSYTARVLALEALDRHYTEEAEVALRRACYQNSAILRGHIYGVKSASFSCDGKRIVSASDSVRIWDSETGACIRTLKGHTDHVNSVSFSPDGKRVVSASDSVRIWDSETGTCIRTLKGHTDHVNSASFSRDGKRIVSASLDGTVRIWNAETGDSIRTLKGHNGTVYSASFSRDGKRIVSASSDRTVRIWDSETGVCIRPLGHTWPVYSASFSPDGKRVVSVSSDRARIWDSETGTCIRLLEGDDFVNSVSFSRDGKRIVSASWDGAVRIWDSETGACIRILKGHTEIVNSASFSCDGKRIVSASDDRTVRIWDAEPSACIRTLKEHRRPVTSVSFSRDGRRIVSASWDRTVRIWDSETGTCIRTLKGHTDHVNSASFSRDGKRIVSASLDGTVRIWNAETGDSIRTLKGHTDHVNSASFSPDGKKIVSASSDRTVRIWDSETGGCIAILGGQNGTVDSASFSPDGKRIVSASLDGTVRIWDSETGACIRTLKGHTDHVNSASFSRDGKRIVSASWDGTIRIWNAETGACIRTLKGYTDHVNSASFSRDGKRIVSASWDGTVRIWDSETGECIAILGGQNGTVHSASFSPDGKKIVSESDGEIQIWSFFPPFQQLMEETQKRFENRKLTPEEKRKYYLE